MNPAMIVLAVLLIAYLLVSRMAGQVLKARRLIVLPAILAVVGASSLDQVTSPTAILFLGFGAFVGIGIGALRGVTVQLFDRDGIAWMRYSVSTVALWVLAIAARLALVPVERALDPVAASTAGHAVLLSIGIGILAESAVVLYRAVQRPATIVWSTDEKSGRHVTRQWLTDLHTWVRS